MPVRPLAAVALLALAPALALAAPEARLPDSGPLFGLRAGYAVPSGDVVSGGPALADVVSAKVPLGLELGYRLSRRIWAELHFELAPAMAASALCAAGTSCTASDVRFGLALQLRILPGARIDPWVGAGAGVEVLNAEGRDPATGARTSWSWAGVDLPYLEAGADVAVSDRIGVGPWGSVSFVRFTSDSVRVGDGDTVSGAVRGRVLHRWFAGGVQATVKL